MISETTRQRLHETVESVWFNKLVVAVIVLNAALIGLYTYTPAKWILAVEWVCVGLFVVELILRFLAAESKWAFFRDPWTIFDIVIIAAAFVPAGEGLAPILRILRVLRVLRLVKTVPQLRMIAAVLTKSVLSMHYIAILAAICFYVYAVIGVKLFSGAGHPLRDKFPSVHEACFTLFRVLTGDDWTEMRYAALDGPNGGLVTVYFVTWIIIATFVLTNLIVGAIVNHYQEVQEIEHPPTDDAGRVLNAAEIAERDDRRLQEILEEAGAIMKRKTERARETPKHRSPT